MSVFTNFLNLFKYNPTTDGENTFNIDTALNQNWDKVDAETQRLNTEIVGVKTSLGNISTTWDGITGKPTVFPPSTHAHGWTEITSKPTTFAPSAHNHDDRYYTETEVNNMFNGRGLLTTALEFGGGNLNSLSSYCVVKGANMANAPDADWWYVEQFVHGQGTWHYQRATPLNRPSFGTRERWLSNGTWTAWENTKGSGGDMMGKKYVYEQVLFNRPVVTGFVLAKTYNYAKGGMVKIGMLHYPSALTIYVDGVLVVDNIQITQLVIGAVNNYTSSDNSTAAGSHIELPFETSFEIYVYFYSTEATTVKGLNLQYYLNR